MAKKKLKRKAKKKTAKKVKKKARKKAKKVVTGFWSAGEVARLRKHYPHMSTRKVAQKLGRTTKAVEIKAFKLGLRKSKKYLRDVAARLRRVYQ